MQLARIRLLYIFFPISQIYIQKALQQLACCICVFRLSILVMLTTSFRKILLLGTKGETGFSQTVLLRLAKVIDTL